MLLRFATIPTLHVRPTAALSRNHIATVIQRSSRMTVTHGTTLGTVRKSVGLRNTLVTIASGNQPFTNALSGMHIASSIVHRTQNVARTSLASIRIALVKVPETFLTMVASSSANVLLAMASPSLDSVLLVGYRVTDSVIQGPPRITIARLTHVWTLNILQRIPVEERRTLFAVIALCIVLAIVTNTSAYASRVFVHSLIEMTARCVIVTVTFCELQKYHFQTSNLP